jgi:two-component system, OmpR family, phosphate regulon sensor histidine kinase PhoR
MKDLADQQNKLVSILTSMDDGVIVLDKNEKIILMNPAAKRLFEINNDVIGKYFIEAIRNYDFENIIQNKPDEDVEITVNGQLQDKGQTSKNFRIRTTKVVSNDVKHENELVLLVVQDITKIKALEEMRTDFVANVSHELKTPLTSIKGFAETLKMVDDKETKDKFLDIINVEAERLTRLINDILTLSEIESKGYSVNRIKININSIIMDVFHIMEPVARNKNIALSYESNDDGSDNGLFIQGDKDKFKQMMINLVDNAIKYTNNNGTVKIKTLNEAGDAIILVEDNGIGIPREHISRLFERFYRVDKARSRSMGGTGLGLAIVKHILILFNGSIEVKSEVGKGTTFTIFLPLA